MKDLRSNYEKHSLKEADLFPDPFSQFHAWFNDALQANITEPNAMVLSTLRENAVDSRTVLLKGLENNHFVFYTNYHSNKGRQLEANPECSLLFLWLEAERQVIVRGRASKVSRHESETYFEGRPRGSQIGAWVSEQSQPLSSRDMLENRLKDLEAKFKGNDVPTPPHWGGYKVKPYEVEFWQGRPNRLHDRILFKLNDENWSVIRLQP